MTPIEMARSAAAAAADKKAVRMVILDLRGESDICDFQVICSGESERQAKAIAQGIEEKFKKQFGVSPLSVEGKQNGHWILLDYGPTIVHVFFNYVRDYYALEKLWPKAKFVETRADS